MMIGGIIAIIEMKTLRVLEEDNSITLAELIAFADTHVITQCLNSVVLQPRGCKRQLQP
jgi:hypothetical protein